MKNLLEYLVKNFIDQPEEVSIKEEDKETGLVLWLKTVPEDIGKIIGKKGKTITALRNLLRLRGMLEKKKVDLQLIDQENK